MELRDCYLLVAAAFISAGAFLFPVSVSGLSVRTQRTTQHPGRGVPDRSRGQPFSGPGGRSQSDRQQLKDEHLNRYRLMILQQLGLPDNRTDFRVPGRSASGGGAAANRTAELMRIEAERRNQQIRKETRKNSDKKNSKSQRETVKTILFGEKVSNGVMSFKLSKNQNKDVLVTGATITVLVQPPHQPRTGNASSKPETDRPTVKIYALSEHTDASVNGGGEPITEMKLAVRKRQLQRLLLPTSLVQEAIDARKESLFLRIVCDRCLVGTEAGEKAGRTKRKKESDKRPRTRNVPAATGKKPREERDGDGPTGAPYLTISSKRKSARSKSRVRSLSHFRPVAKT